MMIFIDKNKKFLSHPIQYAIQYAKLREKNFLIFFHYKNAFDTGFIVFFFISFVNYQLIWWKLILYNNHLQNFNLQVCQLGPKSHD